MDLENVIRTGVLLDLYGELLAERPRLCMERYYNEDWSLAEIAGDLDISRQAVHDHLHRSVEQLERYEAVLGLAMAQERRRALATDLLSRMTETERRYYRAQIEALIE